MNGKHPEKHDYPASQVWREYYAESRAHPKLKKPKPKTIRVAGMTLHNIDPNAPIDDTTGPKLAENLRKLGLQPNTEKSAETPPSAPVEQADFLDLVPVSKGREPKKIHPAWHSDTERVMEIASDDFKRPRALASDVGHNLTLLKQQRRKDQGLPPRKLSFKEMLKPLTKEEVATLTGLGFNVQKIRRGTPRYERMIRALIQYQKSK
jgi:hypothetical protein